MDNPIFSFFEFQSRLGQTIEKMKVLAKRYPDPSYNSIIKQLEFVAQNTTDGKRLRDEDLARLSFGLLASKNVDDTDQPLACELYLLASTLSDWPANRPIWR